jgi:hypothetical protein
VLDAPVSAPAPAPKKKTGLLGFGGLL